MGFIFNVDLLSVGIAIAANVIIGYAVFRSNRGSITNRLFFAQTIILSVWSLANYLSYQSVDPSIALMLVRLVLFLAVPNSICFLILMHTFPAEKLRMSKRVFIELLIIMILTMALTLSPLVFSSVTIQTGNAPTPIPGPGILGFAIVAVLSVLLGIFYIIRNYYRSQSHERNQYRLLIAGIVFMFSLIFVLDFILPSFFGISRFIPLSAVFTFPFVILTAYAIYRENLFKVRDVLTVVLTFSLVLVTFVEIIFASSLSAFILDISVFILALIIGIQLIRKTYDIEESNDRQETLIHFIGHEVKGFLAKDVAAFAAVSEGDFGTPPETMKPMVDRALAESRSGVKSVETILKAANLKKGTVSYAKAPFDLRALAAEAVEEAKAAAEKKGLALSFSADDGSYEMTGDKEQINDHVLRNLIENSINYTPTGSVAVSLKREKNKFIFAVKDTGIGITPEDKQRLFTEGGHGKDSQKVNAHSTGYGLYIAKQITEAHGGTIRAESEGQGKGSTFIAEFPA
jgi:signal transduction histidine kinase